MRSVLVSGAGVAGSALAHWLRRHGFRPTVVERAPALPGGGFAVDFRGHAHLGVLGRMGVLEEIRAHATGMGEACYVDARGRVKARIPSSVFSGDVEILRSDLGRILFASAAGAEFLFGDEIIDLRQDPDGVDVTLARGGSRRFDLAVGADGLHSGVRRLAFGPEERFRTDSGYRFAIGTIPNHLGLDRVSHGYAEPGRSVTVAGSGSTAKAMFTWFGPDLPVREAFAGAGWETPVLLDALDHATDLYRDSISRVTVPRLSAGRVVLLGDAGYGATLGGYGTGLAVVGAYVLAGELASAAGEHHAAFAAYEQTMTGYAAACRKVSESAGSFLAPRTRTRIVLRDLMVRALALGGGKGFARASLKPAEAVTLRDYPVKTAPPSPGRSMPSR